MTRVSFALAAAVFAVAGCKHRLAVVPCDPACPPPAAHTADCPPAGKAPDCTTPANGPAAAAPSCIPQVVETRGPETIHVKAPAEKITVILPPECPNPQGACATPPHGFPGPAMGYGPAPAYGPAPGFAPAPAYAPVAAFAPSPGYAPAGLLSSTQTVRPRNRIALGLDTIRVPLLIPKLFSVEREQEVVTRQRFSAPAAPQMAFAPAPQMAFAPAPQMALAPVPQMALAPAPQPQMAFAPAPQPQMMFAPQPQPQPQMMFAPQPQPQMMLAPAPAPAPPLQGMICVPTPGCQPACPAPCPPAPCPADCPPATSAAPLMQHLDHVQQQLNVMEHQYRARMGVVPAGTAVPAPRR